MSVNKLPVETLCKIFLLSVQAEYPSFMLSGPELEDRSPNFEHFSPTVLASVCKYWEKIALSDPVLWATLFLSLRDIDEVSIKQARTAIDICLTRSGNVPLSLFVSINTISSWDWEDDERAFNLLIRPLLAHQKRWRSVDFRFPDVWEFLYDRTDTSDSVDFVLRAEDLTSLTDIRVDTKLHSIDGASPLSPLVALELVVDDKRIEEAAKWISRCPNIERLNIFTSGLDEKSWEKQNNSNPISIHRLRTLKLHAPLSALKLLDCPTLESLAIVGGDDKFIDHYRKFLSRIPPLRTLHILNIEHSILVTPTRIGKFLVPTLTNLVLTLNGLWNASPTALFELLSEKRTVDGETNAGSEQTFSVLPRLESLVLAGAFFIPLPKFVEFVSTRWKADKAASTFKSMRLMRCYIQLSPGTGYFTLSEPEVSSAVLGAMKPFVDEGLEFEIS